MRALLQSELTELAAERGELTSQGLCFLGLGKCAANQPHVLILGSLIEQSIIS